MGNNKQKVISKLKGLSEFIVLQRDFMALKIEHRYALYDIQAKDEEEAWQEVEDGISDTNSQEWLMTREEAKYLAKFIMDNVDKENEE